MIAQLTGTVARIAAGYIVLDVNGVGYKVGVPLSTLETLPKDGSPVTLMTHLIVREDDMSLYGFMDEMDLRVFELLLTVSGVGPKVGLAMLSGMSADDLARTVGSEDVRTLTKVPGVGAKTAQRMVLELRDKFAALGFERRVDSISSGGKTKQKDAAETVADEVASALENLGYSRVDSRRAADGALEEKLKDGPAPDFPTLFRAALNRLTK